MENCQTIRKQKEYKKAAAAKEIIRKHCKDFGGALSDVETLKIAGCSRGSYYKYKREIKEEINGKGACSMSVVIGRPPFYNTPQDLKHAVDLYFESHKERPTVRELSSYLGYKDRRQFSQQRYRSAEFADVVNYAKLKFIELEHERLLTKCRK